MTISQPAAAIRDSEEVGRARAALAELDAARRAYVRSDPKLATADPAGERAMQERITQAEIMIAVELDAVLRCIDRAAGAR